MTNDYETGREAFTYFYNKSIQYSDLKFNEMASQIAGSEKSVQYFFEGLGLAINSIQADGFLSGSAVKDTMTNLASKAHGKLPTRNSFYAALSGKAQDFSFVEAAPIVIKETASKVLEGAQEVGNAVLDTGKSLLTIMPLVLVGAVIFFVWSKTKKFSA